MTGRRWLLLFLTALPACGLEFIGPESPASALATVHLTQGDTAGVSISVHLEPGFGLDDQPRSVAFDTIQIMGLSLGPWAINHEGIRLYKADTVVTPDSFGEPALTLPAPAIQGLSTPATPSLNLTTREDPFNLAVSNGSDITLSVVPPGLDSVDKIGWRLSVVVTDGPTQGEILALRGNGPPPPQITIPGSITTDPAITALEVRLAVSSVAQRINDTNNYQVSLLAQAVILWAVSLSPP